MHTPFAKYGFLAMLIAAFAVLPAYAAELNTESTLIDETPPQAIPNTAPEFTKVIEDLPLMPGLELLPDNDVLFVAPRSGRIAETTAEGMVDVDAVYTFYRRSLPHLGWKMIDARTYQRDNDVLHIDAHAEEKITTARFLVSPAGEK
jgi:glucose/arabinose dehydrogenase